MNKVKYIDMQALNMQLVNTMINFYNQHRSVTKSNKEWNNITLKAIDLFESATINEKRFLIQNNKTIYNWYKGKHIRIHGTHGYYDY